MGLILTEEVMVSPRLETTEVLSFWILYLAFHAVSFSCGDEYRGLPRSRLTRVNDGTD